MIQRFRPRAVLVVASSLALVFGMRAYSFCVSGFGCLSDFHKSSDSEIGGPSTDHDRPQRNYAHEEAMTWIGQGDVYLGHGDLDAADLAYTKALGLEPGNVEAERKRRAERDARIAKQDTAIAPIKTTQIVNRLAALNDPVQLAHAQQVRQRSVPSERPPVPAMNMAETQHAWGVIASIQVAPGGTITAEALHEAQGIIARTAEGGATPDSSRADAEQLRKAQAVITQALAQRGTRITIDGQPVVLRGEIPSEQFQMEARRAQALLAQISNATSPGQNLSGNGTGGQLSLGWLKEAVERMGGDTHGLCFDQARCHPQAVAAPIDVGRIVDMYGSESNVPAEVRASRQGPSIHALEEGRKTDFDAAKAVLGDRKQREQNAEPDSEDREHIKRDAGKETKLIVGGLEKGKGITIDIDIPAPPAQ